MFQNSLCCCICVKPSIPIDMVNMIQIGVECGYNEGLKKIRKGITVEQLEECVEKLSDYFTSAVKQSSTKYIFGSPERERFFTLS